MHTSSTRFFPSHGRTGASGITLMLALLCAAAAIGGGAWYFAMGRSGGPSEMPVLTPVTRGPFDHIVLEEGEVESASNVEIMCDVEARNSSGTAILWVIDEGTMVKKGDLLCQLDKSALEQELKLQKTIVNSAERR